MMVILTALYYRPFWPPVLTEGFAPASFAPTSLAPTSLAQVSRRPTVRLNTGLPGRESASRQK